MTSNQEAIQQEAFLSVTYSIVDLWYIANNAILVMPSQASEPPDCFPKASLHVAYPLLRQPVSLVLRVSSLCISYTFAYLHRVVLLR